MTPKVSVIMPCYNEPRDVFCRSLESVLSQTLSDIEIILILDNPENTELKTIIEWYKSQYENIIFLQPEENLWRWMARNLGIETAAWKYIAIHDADDIDYPNRLEDQYAYMEENPTISIVFSEMVHVNSENQEVDIPRYGRARNQSKKSFFQRYFNHPTMFGKTEILQKYKYENLNFSEDMNLWIQCFRNSEKMWYTWKIHTRYLAPEFSEHSEFIEKMKGWKVTTMKVLISNIGYFSKDVYFYRRFAIAITDYIFLHMWRSVYDSYRRILSNIAQSFKSTENIKSNKEA